MAEDSILGRIVWYELMTNDMKAAEKFYTAVMGWTVSAFDESPKPYHMWMRSSDEPIGGVMTIPEGMNFPPHWGMYVAVPNLEKAVSHIEQLGGSGLSEVIPIPNVGLLRTMKDPQGAAFSILQPAPADGKPERPPQLGDMSWMELYTTDAEAALKFYTTLFGWRHTESMDMGPMGKYHMFARSFPLGGMMNMPPPMTGVPPHWGFYTLVDDVHAGVERVKANGGGVLNGPMEVPGGDWIVNCMDPQGAAFSLHSSRRTT